MKLVIDLLTLVVKILIKIGDIVLLLLNLFLKIPLYFYARIRKLKKATYEKLSSIKRRLLRKEAVKGSFSNFKNKRKPLPSLPIKVALKNLRKTFGKTVGEIKSFIEKILIFIKNVLIFIPTKIFKRAKKVRRVRIFPIPAGTKFKYFVFGAFFSLIFIFMPLLILIFLQSLPSPYELNNQDIAQTTKIYDRNGTLLFQIFANQNRTVVPLNSIPSYLKEGTIAIEDKNFYTSPGVDFMAIGRSSIADLRGQPLQGGSTIPQQLIKARLLSPERSITRKVKEIILAVWTDRVYTKDQILEMYLNQVPYGGTAWGAQSAAQTYFGKDIKNLDLAQSAFLAGLPQAPTLYSPYGTNPNLWKSRQKEVLESMREQGYITQKQETDATKESLTFLPPQQILHAPHFVMYVRDFLVQKYGLPLVERGGLNVTTSLDLKTQDMTQKIVADEVAQESYLGFSNAASLITNPKNGDILAMVGGKNYYDPNGGNVNVTTANRQPGSTIKVVTYSAALMNGYTAATTIQDSPVSFGTSGYTYSPVNYDGRFHGTVTLRQALANSINVPAVKTLNKIGIPTMVNLAKSMGITTWADPSQYGLSVTLGAAEVKMTDMATVYGTLANEGEKVDLNPILKITDPKGNVLEQKTDDTGQKILPDGVAYIISNILADNNARSMEFGLNSPLVIPGHIVSVKTGTTDNKRDNWTIGYTPNLLTAVWVGNNDNTPMNPVLASGITGAAPIWNKIMSSLLKGSDPKNDVASVPNDIVEESCFGKNELFIKGTEKFVPCHLPTGSPALNANLNH